MDEADDPARDRAARRPARPGRIRRDRRPPAPAAVHGRPRRRRADRRHRRRARPAYPPVDVSPDLVLLVLLPGLVFEAAYRLRLAELRRWFGGLALLAVPGVLISAAIVAVVLNVGTGLRLDLAFIVGAMVSATDPAAVIATFKRLRVPPRPVDDGRRREPPQRRHGPGPVRDRACSAVDGADRPGRGGRRRSPATVAISVAIGLVDRVPGRADHRARRRPPRRADDLGRAGLRQLHARGRSSACPG